MKRGKMEKKTKKRKTKRFEYQYSGDNSHEFWKKINSHKGLKQRMLYSMGCMLQNLESMVLRHVNGDFD